MARNRYLLVHTDADVWVQYQGLIFVHATFITPYIVVAKNFLENTSY